LTTVSSNEQIIAPPNAGSRVAATAAGAAAGQIVPFGGTIVGIISEAISASSAESRENARRAFERHQLKAVELAPGGKLTGSAYLPDIAVHQAKALVISYGQGDRTQRFEIRLSRRRG